MTTAKKVSDALIEQGRKKNWLASKLGIGRPTLDKKLQDNYWTVEEIMKSGSSNFENVKFEADSSILPAHCFVATSKGVVEYFIDDQLNSIGKSLGE